MNLHQQLCEAEYTITEVEEGVLHINSMTFVHTTVQIKVWDMLSQVTRLGVVMICHCFDTKAALLCEGKYLNSSRKRGCVSSATREGLIELSAHWLYSRARLQLVAGPLGCSTIVQWGSA